MTAVWFVLSALLWTGCLAVAASLITRGHVSARFAQVVWRGAALLSVVPLALMPLSKLVPRSVPSGIPDLPYAEPAAGVMTNVSASLQSAVSAPEWTWLGPALLAALMAGWLFRLAAALAGQLRLQVLKSRSEPHLQTIDARPLMQIGFERVPDIRVMQAGSPFVAGVISRTIYIPSGLTKPADLGQIVIHECVHIKRGDLVTRPLERLVADLFWFSPFAWMMRRELDFWREAVCDEIASTISGDRFAYARTLANAARVSAPVHALPVAAFILRRQRSLPMRLNLLLQKQPTRSRPAAAIGASLIALAFSPFALAEVQQDAPGDSKDGEARFDFAVLVSPDARITSTYGQRTHPITKDDVFHSGTDIGAPLGTPVHTPGCGTVVFSGVKDGYGEVVDVAFRDGSKMRFAQLSERLVETGDDVAAGAEIGKVGMSGRFATGPHLHLEHWQPQIDSATGETRMKPLDPQKSAGLVLNVTG